MHTARTDTSQAAETGSRLWCRLISVRYARLVAQQLIAGVCVLAPAFLASVGAAQQMSDSGWAVGRPSTMGPEVRRDTTVSRPIVDLSQTKGPLLRPRDEQTTIPTPTWKPERAATSNDTPRVAQDFDWASSALSDFNLSHSRETEAATGPSDSSQPNFTTDLPTHDTDEDVEFRSPAMLVPRRSTGDKDAPVESGDSSESTPLADPPASSDGTANESAQPANQTSDTPSSAPRQTPLIARPERKPAAPASKPDQRQADQDADQAADTPRDVEQTPAEDAPTSDFNLDTHDLDALLKSWDMLRPRDDRRTDAPLPDSTPPTREPQPRQPQTREPRALPVEELRDDASPITPPDDRVTFKRDRQPPAKTVEPPAKTAEPRPTPRREVGNGQRGDDRQQPSAEPRRQPPAQTQSPAESEPRREPLRQSTPQPQRREPPAEEVTPVPSIQLENLRPLTRNEIRLRDKVRRVLKMYYRRPLNSRDHDPWEMMHGMLAFGVHSRVLQYGPSGKPITAVGWLCYNKPCKQKTLLYTTPEGELRARWGVGVQGHYGQFLAMLAQCRVARNYPIRVDGREFTIDDLIEAEKVTCHAGEELTFKLISLMHYCPSDERWVNDQGAQWDIRRLIREELQQPIRGAPCGGTHRLAGLSLAARTRAKRGEPLDGEFLQAKEFSDRYRRYAFQFQNPDGSLSTNWFRGPGDEEDINRRIKTSGHILEWLLYSSEDEELHNPRIFRAVNYLANIMYSNYSHDWEVGPLCHATHALVVYDERMFQKYDALEEAGHSVAEQQPQRRTTSQNRRMRSR